ncbi:MAG TPA: nuclear transport factor 2 family protein [Terriglobales bacterium]|nr:nuclear transport factor 2 family protein [Terriglobales bacterium]
MKRLSLAVILLLAAGALAQTAPGTRIQSPTRQVTQFGELENQLATAVQNGNRAGMEPLLDGDFAIRTARTGGQTMGRDEYLKQRTSNHQLRSFQIRGIDVRPFGDIAVVNFLYHQEATSQGKDLTGNFFITDVWRKTDAGWKLAVRYSAGPGPVPPASAAPTGKE